MNELETLNMLLRLIGSSPVNSTTTDHPDAANAISTMKRVSRRIQRKGWWCNIDYNIILEPDSQGEIKVNSTISSIVLENSTYVLRGRNIYDKHLQSVIFTTNVVATRVTRILDWDDMPQVMQEVTAYSAAAEFVRDELEDTIKEQSLKEDAGKAFLDLKKQELEEGQYNIFNNPRIARARGGISPYSRSNKRFFGDPDA